MRWLVLLVFACVYAEEKIPKIFKDQENIRSSPDTFTFLSVQTNSVDGAKYHWLKDGVMITKESQPAFMQPFSRQLLVANKGSKDYAGTYQFVMKAPAGTITGRNITVDFTYVGEFDPNLPSKYHPNVTVGQANFVKCPKHTPGSNVIYKWGKSSNTQGTSFIPSKPNYIVLDDGTLFYSHLTEDNVKNFNENEWNCGMEAKVEKTSSFKFAELKTKLVEVDRNFTDFGPKIVTSLPQDKWFGEGETISMKCAAAGKPTPSYSWKRIDVYGEEFEVKNDEHGIIFEDGDARLLVVEKAMRRHAGRYFCTATIGDKNDTVEGSLKFEVKPSWVSETIKSVKPSIYSRHSWTCNATGFPMPTYKWYKNNNPLTSSAKHTIDGGTLTFPSLEKGDTGMYECVAHNRVDNIYQTAYLDVQAEKPVFDTNTGKTTLFLGAKGTIKCRAKAAPAAENTWSKDGVDIDFTIPRYTLVNKEDLMIDSVSKQDIGNYTCVAKNIYGKDTKKISVQVVGEITFVEEPKDVTTTRGSQIKLKCRAEGDKESPIKATIKYKWKYDGRDIELNDTIVWSDNAHSLVFLKTQVSQSGEYECIAYIDQPSYAEKTRKAKVVIKGPPEAPNKVKIDENCNSFSAKLMWNIPKSNYETIDYFIIQMATSFDSEWRNISERVSAAKDEKTIDNLSPWTRYRFRVLAINEIGTSAPSEPTLFKDCETPPSAPTICPEIEAIPGKENELTVKWKKIELIDQNGQNFSYRLEYSSPQPKFSATKIFGPYELTFEVPDAGYYRPWTFKVQGFNSVGDGPFCRKDSYSGQNAPTKSPTGLTVKEFGDKYFVVQWNEITLTRGGVDGYELTYSQQSTSSKTRRSISGETCDEKKPCQIKISGSGKTTARLEGLLPYTKYRIAVRGFNSGGPGPIASISAMTLQARPGPPSDVKPTAFAKFIKLEWREPTQPNGVITGYNVSIDKDAKPRQVVVEGTVRKYVFGGLVPNKVYIVHIQAKTNQGFGEKDVRTVTTTSLRIPAKPKAPVLTGIGENGVNVTFNEGKPEEGFPETFVVVYRVKGAKDVNWTEADPVDLFGPDSKTYTEINDLDGTKEYEMATISVNEKGRSPMSDIVTVTPGSGEGTKPKAQSNPVYKRSWFVAIVVIVCFLLIILVIALLITRKRGERYPVGKREKKRAGILDVGEEPEVGLYPMKPPRQNGNGVNRQDSGVSYPNRDPDADSLDEYGEDRFDEDTGSLIGAYNDDRKHNKGIEEPEFV